MSESECAGLGAGGGQNWNVLPSGLGDFAVGGERVHLYSAAVCREGRVEVNTASGSYINHHMSASLNKIYSLLCFP